MEQVILSYPVILTEYNDESGHYFVVTSPNIQGLVADGNSIAEALENASDAIATAIDDEEYPKVQDPKKWKLEDNQQTSWVNVNMSKWQARYGKTVRRNVTIPERLNDWAKENSINVSKVVTQALMQMMH